MNMSEYSEKINRIKELISDSEYILIGAGSGLSTAAGIDYAGEEFKRDFKDFINKYHFTDLYTASFYNFQTEEEKWAYFAKHIYFADTGREAMMLYKKIFELLKDKNYFIITTNVDDQFYRAGFDKDKVFDVQGSYSKIQCSKACHNKLYDVTDTVLEMINNTDESLKIPTRLVPICPVCGENMDVNLRKDVNFVQDDNWYKKDMYYNNFLDIAESKKTVLLELGVRF